MQSKPDKSFMYRYQDSVNGAASVMGEPQPAMNGADDRVRVDTIDNLSKSLKALLYAPPPRYRSHSRLDQITLTLGQRLQPNLLRARTRR